MTDQRTTLFTLAQDGTGTEIVGASDGDGSSIQADPNAIPTQPSQPSALGGSWFMPVMLMFVAFLIISTVMSSRKEKKKRAALLGGIKKHDRVQTIGGIIGVISEIRDDEMVLKVDESSNTRVRVARSAVQQVLKSAKPAKSDDSPAEVDADADAETAAA